eukprot:366182-Chlamydomonas_euryale.AAC.3
MVHQACHPKCRAADVGCGSSGAGKQAGAPGLPFDDAPFSAPDAAATARWRCLDVCLEAGPQAPRGPTWQPALAASVATAAVLLAGRAGMRASGTGSGAIACPPARDVAVAVPPPPARTDNKLIVNVMSSPCALRMG